MTDTLTRRAPSSVGNPLDVDAVASAILANPFGVTVDAAGRPYTGDGILVARPEHSYVITADQHETIAHWVASVAPEVTAVASPRRYFGAWTGPDGYVYLDVVDAFSSADEDAARAAGRARDQIAIWHNGRQQEIPTGGNGKLTTVA